MDIIAKAKTTNLATITFIKWIMGALKNLRQNLEKSLMLWRVENLLEEAEILEKKHERVPQEIETIRGTRHELFKMMIKSIWRFNKVEDLWFKTENLIKTNGAKDCWNGIYFQFQGIEKGIRLMQSSLHSGTLKVFQATPETAKNDSSGNISAKLVKLSILAGE